MGRRIPRRRGAKQWTRSERTETWHRGAEALAALEGYLATVQWSLSARGLIGPAWGRYWGRARPPKTLSGQLLALRRAMRFAARAAAVVPEEVLAEEVPFDVVMAEYGRRRRSVAQYKLA